MRNMKILSLILAVLMLTCCFVSCKNNNGGGEDVGEQIMVHITITAYDDEVLLDDDIVTQATNVYNAVKYACEGALIEYGDDGNGSFNKFGTSEEKTEDGLVYFWNFTLNGRERSGRSTEVEIKDNDEIHYFIESMKAAETDENGLPIED